VGQTDEGYLLPVRSVGVQGDSRSYRNALALCEKPSLHALQKIAPELTNRRSDINRVIALCGAKGRISDMQVFRAPLNKDRLDTLRDADAMVRQFCIDTGFEDRVWQFPVVLLPLGTDESREAVVLRPINSVDGMTADVVLMPPEQLEHLTQQLLALRPIAAVFYDLTNKPPGTIEWE
jgi:GMP synthase (glutamine-hydrolysing)